MSKHDGTPGLFAVTLECEPHNGGKVWRLLTAHVEFSQKGWALYSLSDDLGHAVAWEALSDADRKRFKKAFFEHPGAERFTKFFRGGSYEKI